MLNRLALSARSHNAVNLIKPYLNFTNYKRFHVVSGGLMGGLLGFRELRFMFDHDFPNNDKLSNTFIFMLIFPVVFGACSVMGGIIGPPGMAACYLLANSGKSREREIYL